MTQIRFPDGQVVTVERTTPDFAFSAVVPPGNAGPPAHRHRHETEHFTVEEGRLRVRVGRDHRILLPGESISVPPGTTHAFANPFDEPAVVRTVESPAGPLLPQFHALAAAGRLPPLGRLALINAEHDWSFTLAGLPDGPQRVLWRALAWVATPRAARRAGGRPSR